MTDLHYIIDLVSSAEREAAKLMLQAHDIMAETKTDRRNVVTEYDRRVQELLIRRLSDGVPGARFFCEENSVHDELTAPDVFVIDPIDGTMNFVRHMHHSCVSVAYLSGGETKAACVYDPYKDELFSAILGEGAKLNGRAIHVDDAPLAENLVCLGTSPYRTDLADETFRLARIAYDAGLDLRRFASAELDLCAVAAGRAGLYFELYASLWDFAAGALIVLEAGGVCTDISGAPLRYDGNCSSVAAGGTRAYADFMGLIK